MLKFWGADDFMRNVAQHRVLWLSGRFGSGKSSLAVAISYMLERRGFVRSTVSNMPISWAVPSSRASLRDWVAIFDEVGFFFDARNFADKKQNEFRKGVVGFLRKVNGVVLLASRVAPDASFRVFGVQRLFDLSLFGLPLEIYSYTLEDVKLQQEGVFYVWDRASLWRRRLVYLDWYVPSGVGTVRSFIERAIELAMAQAEDEPNEVTDETWRFYEQVKSGCGWGSVAAGVSRMVTSGPNLQITAVGDSQSVVEESGQLVAWRPSVPVGGGASSDSI